MSVVAGANSSGSSDVVSKCLVATQKQCGIDVITCIMQQCLARVDRKVFLIIIFSLEKLPGLHSGDSTLIFSYKTNTVVKQTEHVEFRIVVE